MSNDITTNGENQAEHKIVPLWEVHGISRQECHDVMEISNHEMLQLGLAEWRLDQVREFLQLLMEAEMNNGDLSNRAILMLDHVQKLLKKAVKNIKKYERKKTYQDLQNVGQGSAS